MIRTLCLTGALALLAAPAMAQTVVIVRHAEKADASSDPDLSEAGRARAAALAAVVAGMGVDHIVVSPLKRTGQTVAPAAEAAGLTPEAVSLEGGGEAHVAAVAARARQAGPEETVLIAGHSNTVPAIARALGGQQITDMEECEYDRLIVLRLAGEAADTLVARYGDPTECPRD